MTPAQLRRIEEIFRAALDQRPEQLSAFLDIACEGDEELRRKVEMLLSSREGAVGFIETPAVGLATKIIQTGEAQALVGRTIGHYKIAELLGTGGMGEVYLATDITAGRKAAVKLLPTHFTGDAKRLKRFQQEARAVVALNHPNILTVYEIGEDHSTHYIASELIEGETLRQRLDRGRMEVGEAVDIAIQVASAVAAAHAAGIVHRDIKPENIMIRPDGYVKVLDFGIAKLAESAAAEPPLHRFGVPGATANGAESTTVAETNIGSIVGTARYMSPEQARGAPVDKRSDVWSLGVVLYEIITGHAPFTGDTSVQVMSAIRETEPAPLTKHVADAPTELQQIISKALRKDREKRYQSAHDLLEALKDLRHKVEFDAELKRATSVPSWLHWIRSPAAVVLVLLAVALVLTLPFYSHRNVTTATSPLDKSIAVLPFENLSNDREDASFADGVQDDLLTKLARIADLKVISRTSVLQYRDQQNTREIGNALGVAHVLEGSVRKTGAWLHINVQLIDTRTDTHVWAEQYDRDLKGVFAIQSEIAQNVAQHLHVKISSAEKVAIERPPTADLTAFDLYNRAKNFLLDTVVGSTGTRKANLFKAADLLNQAVAHDPTFFQAYCQLAWAHDYIYFDGWDRTPERLALAEAAIQGAFRLHPDAAEAHLARAWHLYWGYRHYDAALTEVKTARLTLPNDPWVLQLIGFIQRRQGRWEESTQNLERALELDPRNFLLLRQIAILYDDLRRYAEQQAALDRALALRPNDLEVKMDRANVEIDWKANTAPVHQLMDEIRAKEPGALQSVADYWLLCALAERDSVAAGDALAALGNNSVGTEKVKYSPYLMEGLIGRMTKNDAKARAAFTAARAEQEKLVRANPDDAGVLCILGLIDAGLGRKEEALREGWRAVELLPVEKDARSGPAMIVCLARIAAWVGDNDLAFEQLARAARLPSSVSYGDLKLMPWWDPLRGDPRFEKIVASLAGSASNPGSQEKSIAVLPFENLSNDREDAPFADGVQDDILTKLAKIADLKVISRTSVMQYRGNQNPREIGDALRVSHVLQGSVRKTGAWLHVNAQLIDTHTDTHVWAEQYDRDLKDIFAIQSEIAQKVAERLHAKISAAEEMAIQRPPTADLTAFDLYSRAKNLVLAWSYALERTGKLVEAADLLNQAVAHDPTFFQAYCQLVWVHDELYHHRVDRTPARLALAEAAIDSAFRLRPDAGEAHLARAGHLYRGYLDYDGALAELEIARQTLANDARLFELKGYVERRRPGGNQEEALRNFEKALDFDPRNVLILHQTASSCNHARRYAEEEAVLDRLLTIEPNDVDTQVWRAFVEFDWKADTRPLHHAIDEIRVKNPAALQKVGDSWFYCALAERDAAAAANAIAALGENKVGNEVAKYSPRFLEGLIARMIKDDAKAEAAFTAARAEQEKQVQTHPDDAGALSVLGLIDAALGRKEEALREGRRAIELLPVEKDTMNGGRIIVYLAMIATWVGDRDLACKQLAEAIRYPTSPSYGQLKLLPTWDPLRGDPCFEKIVASLGPK